MHERLHVCVAIHASEHGAVDGVLEFARIDKEALLLPVHVPRESGVAVTGEAVFILKLVLSRKNRSPNEKSNKDGAREESSRIHANTMHPRRPTPP
jgi:hypothetical protein